MRKRSMLALLAIATVAAAVVAGLGTSVAFAGEVTGNCSPDTKNAKAADNCKGEGTDPRVSNGNSWCSYSGHNDDPNAPLDGSGPNGPGGPSQSYGQDVKLGLVPAPSTSKGNFPSPGTACNPNDPNNFGGGSPPPRK